MLVAPLRQALQSQGLSPTIVTDAGDFDGKALLTSLVEDIEIRSAWTPAVTLNTKALTTGPSNPFWKQLRPTVTLSGGKIGRAVLAPYGEAPVGGSNKGLVVGGVALLGIFSAGLLFGATLMLPPRQKAPARLAGIHNRRRRHGR